MTKIFDKLVLSGPMPYVVLLALLSATLFFSFFLKNFRMDASTDSIILENDADLHYYDESREIFGSDDYVFVVVQPSGELFAESTLRGIRLLSEELARLDGVSSVVSIVSVPLFHSPKVPLLNLTTGYKTLSMEGVDKDLARKELIESPLFRDYLISEDAKTTVIQVNFKDDPGYRSIVRTRNNLQRKKHDQGLTLEESRELEKLNSTSRQMYENQTRRQTNNIAEIRRLMANHTALGTLYLGGVPMIVSDMVRYIRSDIMNFGVAVLLFIVLMLAIIFRRLKLFLLPMMACVVTLVIMVGYLGYTDWRTTVVTANFTSLLLIMTTENAIHLATQWRELLAVEPALTRRAIVLRCVGTMGPPCFFSTLTTVVGFGSLYASGLRPVKDFGMMMVLGLCVGYAVCFLLIPAALVLLPKGKATLQEQKAESESALVSIFAKLTERYPKWIVLGALILFALGALGSRRLTVENRFIDHFRESTPIYEGMIVLDEQLGGTAPLEVILDGDGKEYWLKVENLAKLRKVHQWLDDLPETGKVLSIDTMIRVLEKVNNDQPLNQFILNLMKVSIPPEMAKDVLRPYVDQDFTKVRIAMRVRESDRSLRRKQLLERIRAYLDQEIASKTAAAAHVTGMFVLYNNMLQSLFTSQIATVTTVLLSCFVVFSLIFRSIWLALIGLVPNILAVTIILGTIGWLGIPLDMMTIMVAAITFGLADDNTIHYVHRFRHEFLKDRDYTATMYRCHNSIGRPLSYTMITIIVGFSILCFSNFIPTVYFGIFTGLAMFLALMASHTLLPLLILYFKPLGRS